MTNFEGKVKFTSLSKQEKEKNLYSHVDDYSNSVWPASNGAASHQLGSKSAKEDISFQFPFDSEDFIDGGYDSSEDPCNAMEISRPPEVNLKNVLSGIVAILTGRNKGPSVSLHQQLPSSNVSFLGSEKNGDTYLHSSVYIPSAPPLLEPSGINYSANKEVLEAEPPEWLPDSSTTVCMQCTAPFTALTRGRHHCRFCGGVFCRACTKGRCLLPVKFRERDPQRVCDACYDRLDPLQGILINTISNAVQAAKHDVMDWTCTRGWLNLPVGLSMEHEIYKASNTLRSYCQIGGELLDFIIVLHDTKAVKTFCSRMHLSLGAGCSAAAGPIGRVLEADLRAGDRGSGMCYTYSCSKGAFVGVSLEGNVVATRMDTNLRFYGDPYLTTNDILLGTVDRPKAAQPLYAAVEDLYSSLRS
ncbi:uncharacterized protein LOC110603785 isoform X2 [Manihot esculenta]|uniref:Uncharacterized protein n=1 Tax=Manihot esculenta TaxID=3983 RepID=A0ACB7G905_MANES|nr:uncharacterized protein LOC110603785 isoform X2 [Manihot esculenta]KAG8636003.1 hypothetical protein MANES_16G090100v8 [Manihot esculenta]